MIDLPGDITHFLIGSAIIYRRVQTRNDINKLQDDLSKLIAREQEWQVEYSIQENVKLLDSEEISIPIIHGKANQLEVVKRSKYI